MKITCWNVNGLRSPSMSVINNKELNKECNLYKLIENYDPDIICFGETKCQKKNEETFNNLLPYKYYCWNSSTEKLGYSGVCVEALTIRSELCQCIFIYRCLCCKSNVREC